jgi:hypothetical protein
MSSWNSNVNPNESLNFGQKKASILSIRDLIVSDESFEVKRLERAPATTNCINWQS